MRDRIDTANDDLIRLHRNENPYGHSKKVSTAIDGVKQTGNLYSFEVSQILKEKLSAGNGVKPENILLSAGSSEILALCSIYAYAQQKKVVVPWPTFDPWTRAAYLSVVPTGLDKNKSILLDEVLDKSKNENALIYICNPNNPTGALLPLHVIDSFVSRVSTSNVVMLDEAYIEYTEQHSAITLLGKYENLVVIRTFSKIHGMAGLRIGYAVANQKLIATLSGFNAMENSTLSSVGLRAALAALDDSSFMQSVKQQTRSVGQYTFTELQDIGLNPVKPNANFIYYQAPLEDWKERMLKQGFLTGGIVEKQGLWTRTSLGTMDQMKNFVKAAQHIIHNK
jgi:histidinol-phosphate aminotransferase